MPPRQIFISYRRDDAAGYARAVYDELARRFGAQRVFIDVDDIAAGQAFGDVIQQALGASAVLLVLIGRRWQGPRDGAAPRLADPADLVRREVATALAGGMHVIPLLLDGATMPAEAELPGELRALAGRNALALDNTRFAADMARLVAVLGPALGEPAGPPAAPGAPDASAPPARRPATARWLAAAVLAAVALVVLWQLRSPPAGPLVGPAARPAPQAAARPALAGAWQADVHYDWANARYAERFEFRVDGDSLQGSASFLGVPRGVLEGRIEPGGLSFVTRTSELAGAGSVETVHRYRGRLEGGEILFVMQTEGGSTPHEPVAFSARRVDAAAASAAGR